MSLSLFNSESLKDAEPTKCDFFSGQEAIQIAKSLALPDQELITQAILLGDSEFNSNSRMNKARYIGRWGKIGEQLALLLTRKGSEWKFIDSAQPRVVNSEKNIQIIIMSGNNALGYKSEILSAYCAKGYMTLKNIKENQSTYDDNSKLRTWILYFPSRKHPCYTQTDVPNIPFEIAFPTSFTTTPKKSKIEVLPSNHSCRIAFEIDNTLPSKTDPKPELEPSTEIKPDDFDIQLVG